MQTQNLMETAVHHPVFPNLQHHDAAHELNTSCELLVRSPITAPLQAGLVPADFAGAVTRSVQSNLH